MDQVNCKDNVLTRIHSECLTGDIFSSSRCDCGEQLKLAQRLIKKEGSGIIIYLRDHEGRGIGLANKISAYALQDIGFDTIEANYAFQDIGFDTIEANIALGLPVDGRSFEIASEIIQNLKIRSIRLMSNNPNKLNSLKKLGISVNSLVPLAITPNKNNFQYLQTKKLRLGHLLIN